MRFLIIEFMFCLCLSQLSYGQTASEQWAAYEKQQQKMAEQLGLDCMPKYVGGMIALMEYLQTNVSYPENAMKRGEEGRVIVEFIVHRDGSIVEPVVIRSVSKELDMEAVRVILNMPKWKPATKNGIPVRVKYTLPINFKIPKDDYEY